MIMTAVVFVMFPIHNQDSAEMLNVTYNKTNLMLNGFFYSIKFVSML